MKTFTEQRKFWLKQLKGMGVKAPGAMYPARTHDDDKEGVIDRMKAHMTELAQMRNYQAQKCQE